MLILCLEILPDQDLNSFVQVNIGCFFWASDTDDIPVSF